MEAFVAAAWQDHADRPEEVADRLASVLSTAADRRGHSSRRAARHARVRRAPRALECGRRPSRLAPGFALRQGRPGNCPGDRPQHRGPPVCRRSRRRNGPSFDRGSHCGALHSRLGLGGHARLPARDSRVRGSPAARPARIAAGLPRAARPRGRGQQPGREPRGKAGSRCRGNAGHGDRRGRRSRILEAGGHLARARARGIPSRAELAAGGGRYARRRRGAAMCRRVRRQRGAGLRTLLRLGRARRCAAARRRPAVRSTHRANARSTNMP